MKANFYEIGAAGHFLSWLFEDNWHSNSRTDGREHVAAVIRRYFKDISEWEGFFIDADPGVLEGARIFNVPGHHYFLGIAGNRRLDCFEYYLTSPGAEYIGQCALKSSIGYSDLYVDHQMHVSCITLEELFDYTAAFPHILSVDIEGTEREVFENYTFQLRPRFIIVDHHGYFEYLVKILENHDYQILNTDLPNEELIAIDKRFS